LKEVTCTCDEFVKCSSLGDHGLSGETQGR